MERVLGNLVAIVLLVSGLVAFSGGTASAGCPYTSGCNLAMMRISAPERVVQRERARICMRVFVDGEGTPRGWVVLRVERMLGGFEFKDSKQHERDGKTCFRTPRLRKVGKYVVTAKFNARPGTRWRDVDNSDSLRVVRRG